MQVGSFSFQEGEIALKFSSSEVEYCIDE